MYIIQVHKVSAGNKNSIKNWTRTHVCYIQAINLFIFFSYPVNLQETEIKADWLIYLVDRSKRRPNIQPVAWVLLIAFCQIHSKNFREKTDSKKFRQRVEKFEQIKILAPN